MYARKWLSNSPEVFKSIPSGDCVSSVNLDKNQQHLQSCDPKQFKFTFSINLPGEEHAITNSCQDVNAGDVGTVGTTAYQGDAVFAT